MTKYLASLDPSITGLTLKRGSGAANSRLSVSHSVPGGLTFTLPLEAESAGSQKMLALYSKLFLVLKEGGVAVIDGLSASLHPSLVQDVISLFEATETNPHGAQLLCSSHDAVTLRDKSLPSDAVWLVNKELDGGSGISRFSGFPKRRRNWKVRSAKKPICRATSEVSPRGMVSRGSLKRIRFSCSQRKSGRSGINKD